MPPRKQHVKVKSSKAFNSDAHTAEYRGPITRSRRAPVQRSPIFKLPLEVLSMIFLLILPSDLELGEEWRLPLSERRLQGRSPLLLCAICSMWRTFALATPQLWRQIFIHIPQDISKTTACSKADHLLQRIQCSGSLPLALYISSEGFFGHGYQAVRVASIISVLQCNATRFGALYLQKPSDNMLLKTFVQSGQSGRSPSRRRVRRPNTTPQENRLISWVQLTHLQIRRSIFPQQALIICKACSKLVWLSINFKVSQRPAHSHKPPIILLHDLVSIFLRSGTGCLPVFTESISAPSLREMCVARDSESINHFLTRSSSHRCCSLITSLIIREVPGQSYDFRPTLDDEILRRLTLHRGGSLCPYLNLLCLRGIWGSHSAVQSMIESRICPQSCALHDRLQYFHLQWARVVDFDQKRLDEVLKRSEMAYSLDWDGRGGSASGWPQGGTYSQDIYCTGLRNW
ncbi:hypothetical protein F5887DRAFT_990593 [Amanita rubescens]|nr:hypothetical protein F5887DRAFT_990593 [Amanita rubescens]